MAKLFPSNGLFRTAFVDAKGMITESWQRWLSTYFGQTTVAAHTITLAKLTGGGTNGSLTWNENGIITGFVDPT